MYKVKNFKIDSHSCDISKCIILYNLISNKKKTPRSLQPFV